jgi:nitrate/nitrite transporter NarK
MGITGAGNSGTLIATLFAPRLAQAFGYRNTFGLAMLPVGLTLLIFAAAARNSPRRPPAPAWSDYRGVLREADTGWFCFMYSLTFGGFVGLASFLTVFFRDQFHVSKLQAGDFTTLVVVAGSFLRPGGYLADRIGGYRLLLMVLAGIGTSFAATGLSSSLPLVVALLFVTMGMLGMGNGAVFQLVPQLSNASRHCDWTRWRSRGTWRLPVALCLGRHQAQDRHVRRGSADVRRGIFHRRGNAAPTWLSLERPLARGFRPAGRHLLLP